MTVYSSDGRPVSIDFVAGAYSDYLTIERASYSDSGDPVTSVEELMFLEENYRDTIYQVWSSQRDTY